MNKLKLKVIRPVVMWFVHVLGSDIRDVQTGQVIGRALLVPWRGRILMLGCGMVLVPKFFPQPRLTFWKRELGFTRHPAPDYPHEPRA